MIGRSLHQFRITAKLGEGGMGVVYRAIDSKLGREVAIKVLPEGLTADPERLARFEREAMLLASLSHQNIAAIFETGVVEGKHFLVMELAPGETLEERIGRGALPVDEAWPIARMIAEGLEAAHERGIIHRDLKPANIKIAADGRVRILDFGLAKALDTQAPPGESAALSLSPTITAPATQASMLLGTAPYMSPEQARGQVVDKRADIWAFGLILFEMLTGERGYSAATLQDTLAAILTRDLDLDLLPDETPLSVRRLLGRCLEKDSSLRLRDIGEARIVLQNPANPESGDSTAANQDTQRDGHRLRPLARLGLGAGLTLIAILAGLVGWALRPEPTRTPLRKLEIEVDGLDSSQWVQPQISPDGSHILYGARRRLWIRDLAELRAREVPASHFGRYPCWAPDSHSVAFAARERLWRFDIDGTESVPLAAFPGEVTGSGGLTWLADGRIVVAGGITAALLSVSDQGGTFQVLAPLERGTVDLHEISPLPDGRGVLFVGHREADDETQRLVDTLGVFANGTQRELLRLEGESLQSVTYAPSGHIVFHRETGTPGVWAIAFDPGTLEVHGEPFLIAADSRLPSAAADGSLLMVHGLSEPPTEIVRVDRDGSILWASGLFQPGIESPALSPDGKSLIVSAAENFNYDLWIYDLERSTKRRMTFDRTMETGAAWSPDGHRIVFWIADAETIAVLPAAGGEATPITRGGYPAWSPDGEAVLFTKFDPETKSGDLYQILPGGSEPTTIFHSRFNEASPRLSPDGMLLAYVSDESGEPEVYVRTFPETGNKWQVSSHGGQWPVWNGDGTELFYLAGGNVLSARIDRSPVAVRPARHPLSLAITARDHGLRPFEAAPDGQSFFVARDVESTADRPTLVLTQNWFAEFKPAD